MWEVCMSGERPAWMARVLAAVNEEPGEVAALTARAEAAEAERDARARDITQQQAYELQDILRTLTSSGVALAASARELVRRYEAAMAEESDRHEKALADIRKRLAPEEES